MNFGEKLKQIRMDRNMTQPQLSAAIGIEQSYLSKLENDKSQPSAETFSAIVKALDMAPQDFLGDIDEKELNGSLRHIPEVSQFLNGSVTQRVHNAKRWLLGGTITFVMGFALMLAADLGIVTPNNQVTYTSIGVILKGESDAIFEQFKEIEGLKLQAKTVTREESAKWLADFEANRIKVDTKVLWGDRGHVFFEDVANGRRKYERREVNPARAPLNVWLQYVGGLLAFCGLLAFFLEWRLRTASAAIQKDLKQA